MARNPMKDVQRHQGRIGRNLNIAFRAERIITRRRMAVFRTQTGLMAFAGLIAGIGIVMISVALFFWLAQHFGNATAGLIVAVVDFVVAFALMMIATRLSAEAELEPVIEVRDLALNDIEDEVEEALDEVKEIADGIRAISRDPFGAAGQSLIGPLVSIILKSLKK